MDKSSKPDSIGFFKKRENDFQEKTISPSDSEELFVKDKSNSTVPWIEKYRPKRFNDIVLDPINRCFFHNILDKNYFPNLIFYGTPGTGKTTTIINLINEYQSRYNSLAKGSIIHLNASDERGVDIIRNHINQFVKSKNMFVPSCKFVILDEVDHMTKNAQQALKYLIQTSNYDVHYCLICNYISKIDEQLQQEFICVRFNQLPKMEIIHFIKNICIQENIQLDSEKIETIQEIYKSDIRSIINFIQLNQNFPSPATENWKIAGRSPNDRRLKIIRSVTKDNWKINSFGGGEAKNEFFGTKENSTWTNKIITSNTWKKLHQMLSSGEDTSSPTKEQIIGFVDEISYHYNMDKKHIIKTYLNYVIKNTVVTPQLLNIIESIIHCEKTPIHIVLEYFVVFIRNYYLAETNVE
jgi:DNA polymerase III delta prime subunit